jgi:hypothetical protein
MDLAASRRKFLHYMAASPLLAELMRVELYGAMQQVGAPTIKDLIPAMVRRA